MPVISSPQQFHVDDLYIDLRPVFSHRLYLKCEGFNFAGSIKLKAAVEMIDAAERDGVIMPGTTLVESSSGNMGIALGVVAASRGYQFICVTDSRCTVAAQRFIEAVGGRVFIVSQPDTDGGFLGARIRHVREICAANPRYVWLNQYANAANWQAHYKITAPAIADSFPALDVLFVGAGTTGTLMGCARYFRDSGRPVTVVAVDSAGSVTFGGEADRRLIPGLGTSVRPALLDETYIDDVVHVPEADAIRACHYLLRRGFLLGGSTGSVVAGALSWLSAHAPGDVTAVAISPDLGERYLDTVYDTGWVQDMYGLSDLGNAAPAADTALVPAGAARRLP
jgi:2,3-diaminopropionate biosynthesis protein SbnA